MDKNSKFHEEALVRFTMYLLASAFPKEANAYSSQFQVFTPAPWELSDYFPPFVFGEPSRTAPPYLIREAFHVLEVVMKRCQTTESRRNFASGISTLKKYKLIDDSLLWAVIFVAAGQGWHLNDLELLVDEDVLSLRVPPRLGRILSVPLNLQVRKIERLTQDFQSHPSRYENLFGQARSRILRISGLQRQSSAQDRIKKALEIRHKVSKAAEGVFWYDGVNPHLGGTPVNELVAAIAISSGQEQNRISWFDQASKSGIVTESEFLTLFLHCKKHSDQLRSDERNYFLGILDTFSSEKLISITLEYALDNDDIELVFAVMRAFETKPEIRSSRLFNQIVQRFLLPQKDFDTLERFLNNPELSSYLDLRAFVHLRMVLSRDHLDTFLEVVSQNSELFEFGIYLFSIARRQKDFHDSNANGFSDSYLSYFRAQVAKLSDLRGPQSADYLLAFLEIRFSKPDFFTSVFGSLAQQSSVIFKADKVYEFFTDVNSPFSLKTIEDLLSEDDLKSVIPYLLSQVPGAFQSDARAERVTGLLVQAFERGVAVSRTSLVEVFVYLASGGSLPARQALIEKLCQLPQSEIEPVVSVAIFQLAKSPPEINFSDELQRIASASGLSVRLGAQAASANADFERGTLFDRYTFESPDQGSWNSLGLILDDVIHELNQPLASVSNWVRGLFLRVQNGGTSDDDVRSALSNMLESLRDIEDRMQDYRALTDGGSDPIWIDLSSELESVINSLKPLAAGANVSLSLTDSYLQGKHYIYSDAFKFRLMIRNLIRNSVNAISQAGKSGKVEVNIFNHPKSKLDVMIQIKDDGPGVPETIQAKLFERGIKSRDGRGLGLGLALAQSVAETLGGNLRLQSTGPSGTTFIIHMRTSTEKYGSLAENTSRFQTDDGSDYEEEQE